MPILCCCGPTPKTCWYRFGFFCSTGTVTLAETVCLTEAEATARGLSDEITEAWNYDSGYYYWRKGLPCTDTGDCDAPGTYPDWPDDLSHCQKYRRVFRCDTDELVDIGVLPSTADDDILPYTMAFKIIIDGAELDGVCYYMDRSETIIEPAIVVDAVVSDFLPGHYEAGFPGDSIGSSYGDGPGWSICRECLGTAIRCDGDTPATIHVQWWCGDTLFCERDLVKTGDCTWSIVGDPVSCGGSTLYINNVGWDAGSGRWYVAFTTSDIPLVVYNDTTEYPTLALGTYPHGDDDGCYAIVSVP